MNSLTDKAQSGDPEALRKLVCEHYSQVFRFCVRRVGSQAAADVTQEVFLTMQQSIKRYENRSTFSTWLLGIAQNHCRNHSRKQKSGWLQLQNWFAPTQPFEHKAIASVVLQEALGKLSDDHREVVVLHELDGMTYTEIATFLGIPEGTVKSRLHHAFQSLRTHVHGGAA